MSSPSAPLDRDADARVCPTGSGTLVGACPDHTFMLRWHLGSLSFHQGAQDELTAQRE